MIDQKYREALAIYKMRNKLAFGKLADRLHVTETVARDIYHGRRAYVSLETAKAIFEIVEEVEQTEV